MAIGSSTNTAPASGSIFDVIAGTVSGIYNASQQTAATKAQANVQIAQAQAGAQEATIKATQFRYLAYAGIATLALVLLVKSRRR